MGPEFEHIKYNTKMTAKVPGYNYKDYKLVYINLPPYGIIL